MPKLIQEPLITYKCTACGAVSSAEPHEFIELNTMPPTYQSRCAFCNKIITCSPPAMIARTVGSMSNQEVSAYIDKRLKT